MTPAQFLIDTSALAGMMRPGGESFGWDQAVAAGLVAVCPIIELEFFYSARSAADRAGAIENMRAAFGWVPVHDRAFSRAWEVQDALTARGEHRSAGPVDLVIAATAELSGLTLLHRDHDFDTIAVVTGQPTRWYVTGLSVVTTISYTSGRIPDAPRPPASPPPEPGCLPRRTPIRSFSTRYNKKPRGMSV